jgi:dTDP-4-dehydrorhamnose reductase
VTATLSNSAILSMKTLIFGATGLLGKALMRTWPGGEPVVGLGSRDADIRSVDQVEHAIKAHAPEWIVLAAAYTDVDGCETNQQLAWDVNCTGAVNVVRAAKQSGARVVFLSTDYVFDGTKRTPYETSDSRAARAVYGKTKAEAEKRILDLMPECCVLRTSWVFGVGGKCFPDTILKLAASRKELEVVDDQRGCPTYTMDLARAIFLLIERGAEGIVHATNRGDCTWYDFAREIVREAGLPTRVMPTTSEKFVRPAERPKYSVLSPTSREELNIEMPTWRDALKRYLLERSEA